MNGFLKTAAILGLCVFWPVSAALALIGTPCDPETDFKDVYLIRNWQKLPHKNQEETKERCDEVNARAGKEFWKYNPTPNCPLYACLSYGASSIADWWAIEQGWKLGEYKSYANGRIEQGFNPRKLEVRYRARSKWNPLHYFMVPLKSERDPVTGEMVPIRPSGYARLLVDGKAETLTEGTDGLTFAYKAGDYPMEGEWLSIVSKNWNRDAVEKKLMKALHDQGPLLVQYEIPKKHYLMGTHAPVVIGHGTLPDGTIAFICHDSFGDFPKSHVQDYRGAPAYRYVRADEIDEAIAFPHKPVVKASLRGEMVLVRIMNAGGVLIPVRRVAYATQGGTVMNLEMDGLSGGFAPASAVENGYLKLYIEADYYMAKNGKGYWLKVPVATERDE
ncbi:MAG TPA: hypothetical protein VIV61_18025 [Candidatus Ozemobacteraceae bacterium]